MSLITFPNAAAVILNRLRLALPALTFVHDIPTARPAVFVRVFRTGGPRAGLVVDGAQITVESWAPTASLAAANAELVRAHLNALPDQPAQAVQVYRVDEFGGPAELPDPASASRRFTWTVAVLIRGI